MAMVCGAGNVLVNAVPVATGWAVLPFLLYAVLLYVHRRLDIPCVAISVFASSVACIFDAVHRCGPFTHALSTLPLAVGADLQLYVGVHAVSLFLLLVLTKNRTFAGGLPHGRAARWRLACDDALTSMIRRRGFDEALARLWRSAAANRTFLSMLKLQIDHFDQFDDEGGHQEADACLLRVEKVLRLGLKENHLLARLGEGKFAVLLPGYGVQACFHLAEQLRRNVAGASIAHERSDWGLVTISVGCATMLPALGETRNSLPAEAHRALLEAKQRGRNRLVSPLSLSPPLFPIRRALDSGAAGMDADAPLKPATAGRNRSSTDLPWTMHSAVG